MATQLGIESKYSGTTHLCQRISRRIVVQFFCALLLGAVIPSHLQSQDLTAESVYSWEFKRSDVRVSDQWPEGWKRRHDRQHPAYINIQVVPRNPELAAAAIDAQPSLNQLWTVWSERRLGVRYNPERVPEPILQAQDTIVDKCLEIRMNGAAAEVMGPVVPLDDRFNYSLDAVVECRELKGHEVHLELQLLDRNLKPVASLTTGSLTGTVPWNRLTAGDMNSRTSGFQFGRVHAIVSPTNTRVLSGTVRLDNLRISRIPRLELSVDAKHNIVQLGQEFTISCSAVGINEKFPNPSVRIQVLNELDKVISEKSIPLERVDAPKSPGERSVPSTPKSDYYVSTDTTRKLAQQKAYDGLAKWKLKLDQPGYYRTRVYLGTLTNRHSDRELPLVVVDGLLSEVATPFGWSLPPGLSTEKIRALPQIVRTYGAGRIKIPIWLDANVEADKIDQLAWLIERLQAQKVLCVGIIDQPPKSQRNQFDDGNDLLPIAAIFQNSRTWEPLIEPILTRMSMKLNWFQLGGDDAQNFTANPQLNKAIADIKLKMQPYSQELQIAIAWSWLNGIPQNEKLAWDALQLSSQPQLTADELEAYANSNSHARSIRWFGLNFLPDTKYSLLDRVRDLTERFTILKKSGAAAAYVSQPLDPHVGLFNDDFEPQPMSVPWRTLVQHLGAADYVGDIKLSNHSINHIFRGEKGGVMLVWNDSPQTEQLYLGDNITAMDLWGRSVNVLEKTNEKGYPEQQFETGPWPILIHGVDLEVARFRMQFVLQSSNLLSITGRGQTLPLQLTNTFSQAIQGKMELAAPTLLQNGVASMPLILSENQTLETALPLQVRSDASAGKHDVNFEFHVIGQRDFHFRSYNSLTLGFDDIEMVWQAVKVSENLLALRLEIVNRGDSPTTFNCKFFPPPFPYQHFQIEKIPVGSSSREFLMQLPKVDDNAEFWIRCEEANSRRTLNYRVRVAKPQ